MFFPSSWKWVRDGPKGVCSLSLRVVREPDNKHRVYYLMNSFVLAEIPRSGLHSRSGEEPQQNGDADANRNENNVQNPPSDVQPGAEADGSESSNLTITLDEE